MMDAVFSPARIAGIVFQNRVLRAATDESMADAAGRPTEALVRLYERLAEGEVGGIITGFIGVSEEARTAFPGMALIHNDQNAAAFRAMTDRMHMAGCPIIAQLAHCGRHGVAGPGAKVTALSERDIEKVIDDFVRAGIRAREAGFDGIELHCAHGYLLSEFLSPRTNKRTDAWGGDPGKRFRIVAEIMERLHQALPDFPVFVKLNGTEKRGVQIQDAREYAILCEKAGIDAIEVSCALNGDMFMFARGEVPYDMICHDYPPMKNLPKPVKAIAKPMVVSMMKSPPPLRMYNVEAALPIKDSVGIPVIAVGGIHDLSEIREALSKGLDAVSMCRPLIMEPALIRSYRQGKQTQARCIRCNHCLVGITQRPLRCYCGKLPGDGATLR